MRTSAALSAGMLSFVSLRTHAELPALQALRAALLEDAKAG